MTTVDFDQTKWYKGMKVMYCRLPLEVLEVDFNFRLLTIGADERICVKCEDIELIPEPVKTVKTDK